MRPAIAFLLAFPAWCANLAVRITPGEVTVTTPHYQLVHDRQRGGALASARIYNGSNRNLLVGPLRCEVDGAADLAETNPAVQAKDLGRDRWLVVFRGRLNNGIAYEHEWLYTLRYARHTVKLRFARPTVVRGITAMRFELSPALDEFSGGKSHYTGAMGRYGHLLGPHEDQQWGRVASAGTESFSDTYAPYDMAVFRRGVEGVQVACDSSWWRWNEFAPGVKGRGRYAVTREAKAVVMTWSPLAGGAPVQLSGELSFGSYVVWPAIPETLNRNIREVVIDSNPWPTEEQLTAWAVRGVNVLRIHEGTDWARGSDHYWHDGVFPPYGEADTAEMKRVISAAHRLGMRIVPYFSLYECHPTSPAVRDHRDEWKLWWDHSKPSQWGDLKTKTVSTKSKSGVYGTLLCLDSGWREWLKDYIRKVVTTYGFDGVYYDWDGPIPCSERGHAPGDHSSQDGIVDVLEFTRGLVGEQGLIICHIGGQAVTLINQNFATHMVTMEEDPKAAVRPLPEQSAALRFMNACPVGIVPNCLYGAYEGDPRGKLKQGIVNFLLVGTIPYSYAFQEKSWGYADWREAVNDPLGLYALFTVLKAYDLSKYKFADWSAGLVVTDHSAVKGALFYTPPTAPKREAIVILANTSREPQRGVLWKADLEALGWPAGADRRKPLDLSGWEYRIRRIR